MGKIFNSQKNTNKRKELRHNMTKAEVLLWIELKGRKVMGYKFRRQFGIDIYVVDFYCPELKLAIEVDGATHFTDEDIAYDKDRQERIEQLGVRFLRFTNLDIYDSLECVMEVIRNKIKEIETTPLLRSTPPC